MENNNTSIIVKNYHKKHPEDIPQNTIIEFFSFCGPIKTYAVMQESNGSYTAIITFESPAAAQVSLLLSTAEIGLEGEPITVSILPDSQKPPVEYTSLTPPGSLPAAPVGPSSYTDVIHSLIQKGYKLKADVLELAKQAEPKVKEALHTAGATVSTTGQVAYDVTQYKLHQLSEATTEAAQVATATVSSYVSAKTSQPPSSETGAVENTGFIGDKIKQAGEAVVNTGQVTIDVTTNKLKEVSAAVSNTSQVAMDVTSTAIHQAGESVAQKSQVAMDALKQAGEAVVNSGQVAVDVTSNAFKEAGDATTNAIQQSGAVDAIKQAGETILNSSQSAYEVTTSAIQQAGAAVVNTGQVAVDVTSNVLHQAGTVVANTGQVAVDVTSNVLHQAGAAVVTTGQVAIDVTKNAIQQSSDVVVDVVKQAAATVLWTGQVAVDITSNTISTVINSLSPRT